MKFLLCGYRDWAQNAIVAAIQGDREHEFMHVSTPQQLREEARLTKFDAIIVVGWSWIVEKEIVENNYVVGMHPSKLPDYAGGSPIQNQILDSQVESFATLFRLTTKLDAGPVVGKQLPYSLKGHLKEVLDEIERVTIQLLVAFFGEFPNVKEAPQIVTKTYKRLKPEHSRLKNPYDPNGSAEFMTCKEMWDFIRCREDPYPNAYFEDETGRLTIKWVEFEPK